MVLKLSVGARSEAASGLAHAGRTSPSKMVARRKPANRRAGRNVGIMHTPVSWTRQSGCSMTGRPQPGGRSGRRSPTWPVCVDTPHRADELARAIETSWQIVVTCLDHWTVEMLDHVFRRNAGGSVQMAHPAVGDHAVDHPRGLSLRRDLV